MKEVNVLVILHSLAAAIPETGTAPKTTLWISLRISTGLRNFLSPALQQNTFYNQS